MSEPPNALGTSPVLRFGAPSVICFPLLMLAACGGGETCQAGDYARRARDRREEVFGVPLGDVPTALGTPLAASPWPTAPVRPAASQACCAAAPSSQAPAGREAEGSLDAPIYPPSPGVAPYPPPRRAAPLATQAPRETRRWRHADPRMLRRSR